MTFERSYRVSISCDKHKTAESTLFPIRKPKYRDFARAWKALSTSVNYTIEGLHDAERSDKCTIFPTAWFPFVSQDLKFQPSGCVS